jgi:hypothetical protein
MQDKETCEDHSGQTTTINHTNNSQALAIATMNLTKQQTLTIGSAGLLVRSLPSYTAWNEGEPALIGT